MALVTTTRTRYPPNLWAKPLNCLSLLNQTRFDSAITGERGAPLHVDQQQIIPASRPRFKPAKTANSAKMGICCSAQKPVVDLRQRSCHTSVVRLAI
jgi:hypothetical protein